MWPLCTKSWPPECKDARSAARPAPPPAAAASLVTVRACSAAALLDSEPPRWFRRSKSERCGAAGCGSRTSRPGAGRRRFAAAPCKRSPVLAAPTCRCRCHRRAFGSLASLCSARRSSQRPAAPRPPSRLPPRAGAPRLSLRSRVGAPYRLPRQPGIQPLRSTRARPQRSTPLLGSRQPPGSRSRARVATLRSRSAAAWTHRAALRGCGFLRGEEGGHCACAARGARGARHQGDPRLPRPPPRLLASLRSARTGAERPRAAAPLRTAPAANVPHPPNGSIK